MKQMGLVIIAALSLVALRVNSQPAELVKPEHLPITVKYLVATFDADPLGTLYVTTGAYDNKMNSSDICTGFSRFGITDGGTFLPGVLCETRGDVFDALMASPYGKKFRFYGEKYRCPETVVDYFRVTRVEPVDPSASESAPERYQLTIYGGIDQKPVTVSDIELNTQRTVGKITVILKRQ